MFACVCVHVCPLTDCCCLELPSLLPIAEVAEALLHVQNGAWLLCRVVANSPDSFLEGLFGRCLQFYLGV